MKRRRARRKMTTQDRRRRNALLGRAEVSAVLRRSHAETGIPTSVLLGADGVVKERGVVYKELREKGLTYREIALIFGRNASTIFRNEALR